MLLPVGLDNNRWGAERRLDRVAWASSRPIGPAAAVTAAAAAATRAVHPLLRLTVTTTATTAFVCVVGLRGVGEMVSALQLSVLLFLWGGGKCWYHWCAVMP